MREIALLQCMHAKGLGTKNLLKLLLKLQSENYPLHEFIHAPKSEMSASYNLKDDIIDSMQEQYEKACQLADTLQQFDIKLIDITSSDYPQKLIQILGDTAPPFLFVKGDISILDKKAVGFCGSRKASEFGCQTADTATRELAQSDVNIVSGYANGIDSVAHNAALQVGGVTTIVLPLGIFQFKLKSLFNEYVDENNILIISEFIPLLGWFARNAMLRNRTICGLSDALVVIEAGESGGTYDAGITALKLNQPLFVCEYTNPSPSALGNNILIKKGGIPIRYASSKKPNLEKIFDLLQNNISSNQTSLF